MNYPDNLKIGDTIGICAPSCGITDPSKIIRLDYAENALREMGYKVIETSHVRTDEKCRSASAEIRAKEFMELYENPEVKLILFASGGEFLFEIYDFLDLEKIKSLRPKWTQGYSDCTGIGYIFNTLLDIPSIYGQTIKDYAMQPLHRCLTDALDIVSGKSVTQQSFDKYEKVSFDDSEETNTDPRAGYNLNADVEWKSLFGQNNISLSGRAVGGCLDVVREYIGTKYDNIKNFINKYKEDGLVWFLECFEFTTPELTRVLWQMKNAGYFNNCNGIIFGRPLFITEQYDITYKEVLFNAFKDYNIPVIYDADIGHVSPQIAMVNGGKIDLTYDNGKAEIKFLLK